MNQHLFSCNFSQRFGNFYNVCQISKFRLDNLVDLKSWKTLIDLQRLVPIQPKTSEILPTNCWQHFVTWHSVQARKKCRAVRRKLLAVVVPSVRRQRRPEPAATSFRTWLGISNTLPACLWKKVGHSTEVAAFLSPEFRAAIPDSFEFRNSGGIIWHLAKTANICFVSWKFFQTTQTMNFETNVQTGNVFENLQNRMKILEWHRNDL